MSNTLDQSKSIVKRKVSNCEKSQPLANPWDQAIAEARQRIEDFKFSIRVFEKKRAEGAPWLGLESAKKEIMKAGMDKSIPA
jgi:hypothetical protein